MNEPIIGPWNRKPTTPHRLSGAPRVAVVDDGADHPRRGSCPPAAGASAPAWVTTEFVWGLVAGIYLGCMATVIGAYLWSFYL